ncbi:hypothetical protein Chor_006367 [Crotalus horridus]
MSIDPCDKRIAAKKQYDCSVSCHSLTGSLNLLVHVKNKQPTQALSLKGDKGNMWQQVHVPINPAGPFQIIFEGVRGTGSEGDIAIDDVTLKKGDCPRKPIVPNKVPILGILLIKDADIMVLDLVLKDLAAVLQLHNEVIDKWK